MQKDTGADLLDSPPLSDHVTDYDLRHTKTYLRLLDAAAEGADWREVASIVLGLDCTVDEARACRVHRSHLDRALWMTRSGYKDLLRRAKLN